MFLCILVVVRKFLHTCTAILTSWQLIYPKFFPYLSMQCTNPLKILDSMHWGCLIRHKSIILPAFKWARPIVANSREYSPTNHRFLAAVGNDGVDASGAGQRSTRRSLLWKWLFQTGFFNGAAAALIRPWAERPSLLKVIRNERPKRWKGVTTFRDKPWSPYNSMLFKTHTELEIRPRPYVGWVCLKDTASFGSAGPLGPR